MPKAKDVNPQKWSNKIVIYDDGTNSAIWGNYNGANERSLGVRWNDGYPSQGGNPLWYVEPGFVTELILLRILSQLTRSTIVEKEEYIENTLIALKEFMSTKV